jgi:two-component system response regulator YesN
VGISLGKYIDDQLIASAQRQLSQTQASIGQISNALGYSNQCYFSRRFKQISGMTPQAYRAKNKI